MKLNVTFEARKGYLYVQAKGQFDYKRARDVFDRVIQEAHYRFVNRILCDITRITGWDLDQASFMNRFNMAVHVANAMTPDLRLALLQTPEQLSVDNFDENVMVNRGAIAKVTSESKEALRWLGV